MKMQLVSRGATILARPLPLVLPALALMFGSRPTPAQVVVPGLADYPVLDNVGGSWVNLATFPVRPMVFDDSGSLWVVNHHDSTVERFTGALAKATASHGVPWSPVSIGWWRGPGAGGRPELLVVCRGTWAVVSLDPTTGALKRVIQLRPSDPTLPGGLDPRLGRMAEPGDILVDEANDRAFVSCMGADSVVQIDLVQGRVVRVFHEDVDAAFRLKSPLFLSFDHDGVSVLCSPLHSGNNSLATGGLQSSVLVRDFAGLQPPEQGLPDEDLFRIRPYVDVTNPGSVEVVLREMGTILFAHGLHPLTSDFWQLQTEANNKDPQMQTEPKVSGQIVKNRISIVQNNGSTWGTSPQPPLELDPGGLSGSLNTANAIGQPFALAFSPTGDVYVAGLLTDNVLVLDQNGGYRMEFDLPSGSIPRGIVVHPSIPNIVLVYCWGTNQVRVYVVQAAQQTASLRATYLLTHDPTPADVAAGRAVFFDGSHSRQRNDSCASCHVEGGSDFLVWNLSNGPLEEKGPMFTQSLVGLERLAPFHWRGERQLADFQPAFVGLLGATPNNGNPQSEEGEEPSDADFGLFGKYVFSLVNPANPNQNRQRRVDPDIHHPDTTFASSGSPSIPAHDSTLVGNAVDGIGEFEEPDFVNVARHSCGDCHAFPTGTINDINVEQESSRIVRRSSMKPAPFHEIWRKHQSLVKVTINEPTSSSPTNYVDYVAAYLGSGFSHLGTFQDLFRFVSVVTDDDSGTMDDQKANDLTDLLHQWDQGLAPAAHFSYFLEPGNAAGTVTTAELDTYLHGELAKKNCDVAVLGTSMHPTLGTLLVRRWAWSRRLSAYVCEDPAYPNRQLSHFKFGATVNGESNAFVGLPLGMAERFAIDYDMDGMRNRDATEWPTRYDPAQPGFDNGVLPGFTTSGAPVVTWQSTKVARVVFETNEPTRAIVSYSEPKTPAPPPVRSDLLSRQHTLILPGLRPSTDPIDATDVGTYAAEQVVYSYTVVLEDVTGNTTSFGPFTLATEPFIVPATLEVVPTPAVDSVERRNMRSNVVQRICMNQGGSSCDEIAIVGGKWRTRVDVDVAFKRGSWQLGSSGYEPVPAPNRVVVGRVLVKRASGIVETATAAGLTVIPLGGSCILADVVGAKLNGAGNAEPLAGAPKPTGRYLAGIALSASTGRTSLDFEVDPASGTGLASGDRILFNVEAVLELVPTMPTVIDTTTVPGEVHVIYNAPWRGMWSQWSFPDTKEARAVVESAPIP